MRITEGADPRSQAERQFAPHQHADYVNLLARFWLSQAAPQDFDPSDIVQDVLLAAHARHEQFRGQTEAQYKAWLRQITRNQVIDALRKRRLPQQAIWQVQDASRWTEQWLVDGATSVVGRAARDELLSILAETLGRLTEPSREAIIPWESYRETPEMAGLKEHLLKTNRHPELARMFQQRDLRGIQQFCHEARDRFAAQDPRSSRMVASWFAVGLDRTVWADSSRPGLRTPVDDRDYTAWAFAELASGEDGGREVFESSLYKSRSDGLYKYAVVARVPSREDPPVILGALAVSIAPESSRAMDSYESLLERAYLWLILASTPWIGLGLALAVWRLRRSGRLSFLGGG